MKKMLALFVFSLLIAGSSALTAQEAASAAQPQKNEPAASSACSNDSCGKKIMTKIMFYIPDRILDFMDTFSLDLKLGLRADAGFRITRAFGLQGGIGPAGLFVKDINRQYGFTMEQGWYGQCTFYQGENMERIFPVGTVQPYWQFGYNFPVPSAPIYDWQTGARDYWAIEASAVVLAGARVAVHPIEIADFICGIFLIDFKGDDLSLKCVRY